MKRIIHNNYFFFILFLLYVFLDEVFFSLLIATNTPAVSGIKTNVVAPLAFLAYALMAVDLLNRHVSKYAFRVFLVMLAILVLYMLTPMLFGTSEAKHRSGLLLLLAETIPAAYIGTRLAMSTSVDFGKIDRLLPFFVIPTALIIGSVGMRYASESMLIRDDDSGLNYQSMSYIMSYNYAYSAYYIFFSPLKGSRWHNALRYVFFPIMLFCAMMCLASGGRGAFIFIIAVTMYIVLALRKAHKHYDIQFIFIVVGVAVLFMVLSQHFDVWHSAGMERVANSLTEDVERALLYDKASKAFWESPLFGHGVGSIWYTVGYYSHNILLDLLAETGVLGTAIFLVAILKTLLKLYRLMRVQRIMVFFMVVFLGTLTMNVFSGYYLFGYKVFLFGAFVYVYNKRIMKQRI